MAGKIDGPSPDDLMDHAEIKALLAISKREPVSCAIALSADKDGVVLMHKKAKPRKLAAMLRAEAKKLKLALDPSSIRFGTASVDTELDSSLVTMRINKEPPGVMAPKMKERLKKAGIQKVEFIVDESLEAEPEEDEVGDSEEPAAAPDWVALAVELTTLVKGIVAAAGGDAGRQQTLVKLAGAANSALKAAADVAATTAAIAALREALIGGPKPQGGSAAPQPKPVVAAGTVAFAKSRLAWLAARKKVESEITRLRTEITETYKDDEMAGQIAQAYAQHVGPVLDTLDERLADVLDDANNQSDPAARAELVAEAKSLIAGYSSFLQADPMIADLDDNPFAPLTIRTTISTTLTLLESTLVAKAA